MISLDVAKSILIVRLAARRRGPLHLELVVGALGVDDLEADDLGLDEQVVELRLLLVRARLSRASPARFL